MSAGPPWVAACSISGVYIMCILFTLLRVTRDWQVHRLQKLLQGLKFYRFKVLMHCGMRTCVDVF